MSRRGPPAKPSQTQQPALDPIKVNVTSHVVLSIVKRTPRIVSDERGFAELSGEITREVREAYRCNRVKPLLDVAKHVIDEWVGAVKRSGRSFAIVEAVLGTRLLVHTKSPYLPLEIGLAWHPLLNLPYIPASTIKGAVRAYMEALEEKGQLRCGASPAEIFGDENRNRNHQSLVEFLDAYPVECCGNSAQRTNVEVRSESSYPAQSSCNGYLLDLDVVTPHYKEQEYAVDEASARPIPIRFLAVAPGTKFRFVIIDSDGRRGSLVNCVANTLMDVLRLGLGAKTSLSYGVFRAARII